MRNFLALFVAVSLLAGCGDDEKGGLPGGEGCLTKDEAGRPLQCTSFSGGMAAGLGVAFCPDTEPNIEGVKNCPGGDGLVGYCELDFDGGTEQHTFYYLPEGDMEDALELYTGMCEGMNGSWHAP